MAIRNTVDNFGFIAKGLHWVIAFLFLMAYSFVYYRHWFTIEKTPENWTVLQLHLSVGTTILALVLIRIIWRISNKVPAPEPGTPLSHLMIRIGHYSLYAIMIIMPITGYIGTGANTEYFFLFDIPKFESTSLFTTLVNYNMGMTFAEFEKPVDFIHKQVLGSWLVWLLISGHILAALYHGYIKKDRTLSKMTVNKY
jgi:cytochrome b561